MYIHSMNYCTLLKECRNLLYTEMERLYKYIAKLKNNLPI